MPDWLPGGLQMIAIDVMKIKWKTLNYGGCGGISVRILLQNKQHLISYLYSCNDKRIEIASVKLVRRLEVAYL